MADKTMSILAFAENVAESHKCNLLCTTADVEIAEEKLKGEHVYRFLVVLRINRFSKSKDSKYKDKIGN